jgi:hypothetical protein
MRDNTDVPTFPKPNAKGNRPALEFVRVSIARDVIKERTALGLTQQELVVSNSANAASTVASSLDSLDESHNLKSPGLAEGPRSSVSSKST